MKRMLTVILVLILSTCSTLPALAARAPVARAVHPAGETATLEGVYQVVKATKKAPAFAVLKLFAPGQFADGEAAPVMLTNLQLMGAVNPALKGKYVRATGMVAASDGTAAFRRDFALLAPTFDELLKPASVALNDNVKKVTLKVGEQLALKAVVKPDGASQAVTFASSAKKVASVSADGVVSALKKGTATITAKTANGKKATVKVTVVIPVTGVKLTPNAIEFTKTGATKALKATVEPGNATNKAVTYASSDEKVATVTKKGVVKSVGAGTAVITATTVDGGLTGTCDVVVKSGGGGGVPATGIAVSPTTLKLDLGKQAQLTATVAPENATNKNVLWDADDWSVVEVSDAGLVTAHGVGSSTVTASTYDGKFTAKCTVTVINPNPSPYEAVYIVGEAEKRNLVVGQTDQLSLYCEPETMTAPTAKKWISINPSIASVNATTGVVTANAPGVALITADTGFLDDGGQDVAGYIAIIVTTSPLAEKALSQSDFSFKANGKTIDFSTTLTEMKAMFPGGTESYDEHDDELVYEVSDMEACFYPTTKRLNTLYCSNPLLATPRGIKIGAPLSQVLTEYGIPSYSDGDQSWDHSYSSMLLYDLDISDAVELSLMVSVNPMTQRVESLSLFRYEYKD